MADAQPGWYPDPAGDPVHPTQLRWWDGSQWTDNYAPAPAATASQPAAQPISQTDQTGQTNPFDAGQSANAQSDYAQADYSQPSYAQQPYAQPNPAAGGYGNPQPYAPNYGSGPAYGIPTPAGYYMSESDRNLRLAAFVLNVLSTIGACWLIIPLAWMIPMTVHSWRLYQGERRNTTGFAVCDLIFCSVIAGILLLISQRDN